MIRTPLQRRLRYRFQGRQIGLLTLVWLVLVGDLNLVTVVGGFLIAWLVTIVFPMPPVHYYGRVHPWGVVKLTLALLRDLATSSFRLAWYAFSGRPVHPGIVRVDLRVRSDLYQVNIAELTSIVPGTIVVDARRRTRALYLHVFDLPDAAAPAAVVDDTRRVERRLVAAFGSASEIGALDADGAPAEPKEAVE